MNVPESCFLQEQRTAFSLTEAVLPVFLSKVKMPSPTEVSENAGPFSGFMQRTEGSGQKEENGAV